MATQISISNKSPGQSRSIATRILALSIKKQLSLSLCFEEFKVQMEKSGQTAFIRDLCYGVARWYPRLKAILNELLDKPIRSKDTEVEVLALLGLYQIEYQETPEHAAVSETVSASKELSVAWAKGLLNAVLRRYLRERKQLLVKVDLQPESQYAHPDWLIHRIQKDWPEHWQNILEENNRHPPMSLRVNLKKNSRSDYLEKLRLNNIEAIGHEIVESAITLEKPCSAIDLPGFNDGLISVQDSAAQLAALLLAAGKGDRILDACAAPGGKTSHILERENEIEILHAIDVKKTRLARIQENLDRLNLHAKLLCADAQEPENWWDNRAYDRILLDVPCSACGVIRRNPDIKLHRTANDVNKISELQYQILTQIWPLLKTGGKLLYCSCSILKQENDEVLHRFISKNHHVHIHQIKANWGMETRYGRQILPGQNNMDGFFYALLEKTG